MPAPVTRSATTVPGSGIAVGGFTVVGGLYIQGYGRVGPEVSPSSSVCVGSVIIGAGDSITGTSSTRSVIGAGDSITGTSSTRSVIGAGDSTTGTSSTRSVIGAGDSITGTSSTGSVIGVGDGVGGDGAPPPQALEKFPGPHTYCAEAGGAAAI